jgi:gliding motility-associated-like protein
MQKFLLIVLLCLNLFINGQTIAPQVINSAGGGGTVGATGVEVYYNIGEPLISAINNSNTTITQGFLQPEINGSFDLSITPLFQNESCLKNNDGFISLALNTAPISALQFLYVWTPSSICPTQNCASVDSLAPGFYSVTVFAVNSNSVVVDSVSFSHTILASTEPCFIRIYNGFTPDGDGINDNWTIDNIENYPTNSLSIFNRWGNKIWSTTNYNNTTNYWNGKQSNGNTLPNGTYFYVLEIDGGIGVKKGWVELSSK